MSAGVAAPSPQTPAHRVPPHHCIAAPWRLACKNLFWLGRIFGHGPQAVMPWLRILRPMRRRRAATRRNTPQHANRSRLPRRSPSRPVFPSSGMLSSCTSHGDALLASPFYKHLFFILHTGALGGIHPPPPVPPPNAPPASVPTCGARMRRRTRFDPRS